MRPLLSRARDLAPFLFSERGVVQLTRGLTRVGGGSMSLGDQPVQRGLELSGKLSQQSLIDGLLSDGRGTDLELENCRLDGTTLRRWDLRRVSMANLDASSSSWEVVDLEQARLSSCRFPGARVQLTSFRDGELDGCDFSAATFVLCDFSGATLRRVDFSEASFVGCSFEGTVFDEEVCFAAADLSGASLRDAWLGGADFSGADLRDTDMRGCLGATEPGSLLKAGARLKPPRLGRILAGILGADASAHRRVLTAQSLIWAALCLVLPLLFFARAISNPVDPDQLPFVEQHEAQHDAPHEEQHDEEHEGQ